MPKITLSYRRGDSPADAGRIFDRLSGHYGKHSVFMDIDTIPFGVDFRTYVESALGTTDIVLAVMGPKWLGRRGGHSRIQDATDPVRLEIEAAMRLGKIIVPVLVANATMPPPSALPESIASLSYLNAAEIDPGKDFHANLDRLIRFIDELDHSAVAEPPRVEPSPPRPEPLPQADPVIPVAEPAPAIPKRPQEAAPAISSSEYARRITGTWWISMIRGVVSVVYCWAALTLPSPRGDSFWFWLYSIVMVAALFAMASRLADRNAVLAFFLGEAGFSIIYLILVSSYASNRPAYNPGMLAHLVLALRAAAELAAGIVLVRYVRAERWRVATGALLVVTSLTVAILVTYGNTPGRLFYSGYLLAGIMLIVLALRSRQAKFAGEVVATK